MPTYEYRCKACGQELEVVQSFTDDALTTCEACGGQLRKVFGNVGIAFKGSGFYKNDWRGSRKSTVPAEKSSSDKASSDTKTSDKSSSDAGSSSSSDSSSNGSSTKKEPAASSTKSDGS